MPSIFSNNTSNKKYANSVFSGGSSRESAADLETVEGLADFARRNGLVEEAEEAEEPKLSFLQRIGKTLSAFETGNALYQSRYEDKSFLGTYLKDIAKGLGSGLTGRSFRDEPKKTYKDILVEEGMKDRPGKIDPVDVYGLAGDILTDPLTFFGGLAGKGVAKGIKGTVGISKRIPVAGKVVQGTEDAVKALFVPFNDIKKLGPDGTKYVDEWVKSVKGTRAEVDLFNESMVETAKKARKVADDAGEQIAVAIEKGEKTGDKFMDEILDTLTANQKQFTLAEKKAGLLTKEMQNYMHHMLTADAARAMANGTDIMGFMPSIRAKLGAAKPRNILGTVEEINKQYNRVLGFDLFEADAFKAFNARGIQSIQALGVHDFLQRVSKNFAKEGTETFVDDVGVKWTKAGAPELEGKLLPEAIAKHIDEVRSFVSGDEASKKFLNIYDKAQQYWKASVTGYFPSFHTRNMIGGVFNNYIAGLKNPLTYKVGSDIFHGKAGELVVDAGSKVDSLIAKDARTFKTAEEFVEAQPKVFRGSPVEKISFGKQPKGNQIPYGAHFTPDRTIASNFASGVAKGRPTGKTGNIVEATIIARKQFDVSATGNNGKYLFFEGAENYRILKEIAEKSGIDDAVRTFSPSRRVYNAPEQANLYDDLVNTVSPRYVLDNAKPSVVKSVLKKEGLDPVIKYSMRSTKDPIGMGPPTFTDAFAVLDESAIKTKSQLKEIWDQANKATPESSLLAEARGKSLEEFVEAQNLYHGTSADIQGGKLSFGAGEIRKGGQSGGLFLSDTPESAQVFGKTVYQASPEIKTQVIDLTKPEGIKQIENYVGTSYKTFDGETIKFTRQDFESMFPNGKTDFASISQYPELVDKVVSDLGKRGIAFNEFAGGKIGKTYQILNGDIPIKTKSQLTDIWERANDGTYKGKKISYDEVRKLLRENGVVGQTGIMDVAEFMRAKVDPTAMDKLLRAPQKLMGIVENQLRVPLFVDGIKKGLTAEQAAKRVVKYHFDYMPEAFTAFEKQYMKRLIPFYTWTRNNVPLQLEQMIMQPGKYAGIMKTQRALSGNPSDEDQSILPDWMKDRLLVKSEGGYWTGFGLPLEEAVEKIANPLRGFSTSLSPLVKVPIERMTGWNIFRDEKISEDKYATKYKNLPKPIKDLLQIKEHTTNGGNTYYTMNPEIKYWIEAIGARGLSTVAQVANGTEDPAQFTALITTIKKYGYELEDLKQWSDDEKRKELEKALIDADKLGKFEKTYIPKQGSGRNSIFGSQED